MKLTTEDWELSDWLSVTRSRAGIDEGQRSTDRFISGLLPQHTTYFLILRTIKNLLYSFAPENSQKKTSIYHLSKSIRTTTCPVSESVKYSIVKYCAVQLSEEPCIMSDNSRARQAHSTSETRQYYSGQSPVTDWRKICEYKYHIFWDKCEEFSVDTNWTFVTFRAIKVIEPCLVRCIQLTENYHITTQAP